MRPTVRSTSRPWRTALLCLAALTSCGGEPEAARPEESTPPVADPVAEGATVTPAPAASADSTDWTIGLLSAPTTVTGGPVPVLTDIRTGSHADYERFTVELDAANGLPGYHVEYVDRPLHECGSGNQIFPVGDAWLELRLEPAAAHTEAGEATLGAREIAVDAPLLRRIYRTCDFEAVVVHVLALSAPNPFRVLTLSRPSRIVVDIQR
jgi:hypothetical protein